MNESNIRGKNAEFNTPLLWFPLLNATHDLTLGWETPQGMKKEKKKHLKQFDYNNDLAKATHQIVLF